VPSRLLSSMVFVGIFAIGVSYSQEGVAEVPIPRKNLYAGIMACGADGQAYFRSIGYEYWVLRVSLDGSRLTFRLPDRTYVDAVAPYATGVNILSARRFETKHDTHPCRITDNEDPETNKPTDTQAPRTTGQGSPDMSPEHARVIYHFDNRGNLLAQHSVPTDLVDTMMATTSSGTTILVGHHGADSSEKEDWKYGGMVLDADDRVVSRFELPSPPAGGTWTFGPSDRILMTTGDRAAYVLLHSNEPPATVIATISESGKLSVKTLPEPVSDDPRPSTKWLVGAGVAVEQYSLVGGRAVRGRPVHHFDEYDLKSGVRTAGKTAPLGSTHPFTAACYYGDSVTGLGGGSPNTPDALWLRIAKLQ
jgi:hypothetical protein